MLPTPFTGIIAALWTPTDQHGHVLIGELRASIEFVCTKGVHAILALGSTGEFVHFELEQRKALLQEIMRHAGTKPVLANISDIRPAAVADLGNFARQCGCVGISLLPPWFFAVAQVDLVEFFVRAAEAAQLPLFLYNFPERTGNRISLETIAAVADRVPLAGVKQSGAEFSYHRELVQLGREKNFVVLTGADTRLAEAMAQGVTGCVSGLANVVPEPVLDIFNAVKAGQPQRAALATQRMKALGVLMDRLEFPLNVAAALAARQRPVGHLKCLVSPTTQARYQELVGEIRQLLHEWNLS